MEFTKDNNTNNRRKLLYWGASMLTALVFWRFNKKVEKKIEPVNEPVKMLAEDGQLVEVDPRYFSSTSRKIKPEEIHTWVKPKK